MCDSRKEKGVIYVVSGDRQKYVEEVNVSIESLLNKNPELPVCVFVSDLKLSIDERAEKILIKKPTFSFFDKIYAIKNSPFEFTLFLDTDTFVCEEIIDIFEMLNSFDVCLAIDPSAWKSYHSPGYSLKYKVPETFPEFNTGVFAFRANKNVFDLIGMWELLYQENRTSLDQPTFRIALYKSNVRICPLIPEYNLRINSGPVCVQIAPKIFHARIKKKDFLKKYQLLSHPLLKGQRILYTPGLLGWFVVKLKIIKIKFLSMISG